MSGPRYAIVAHDLLGDRAAKTAHGVLAYAPERVAAVIDRANAGRTTRDVLPHLAADAPIVASVAESRAHAPGALLVGVATAGGVLPPAMRRDVLEAIEAGLDVHSGLHEFLRDDAEFARAAAKHGVTLVDLRLAPDVPLFSGDVWGVRQPIVLTVGSDCAVGKMTVSLELVRAAREAGTNAAFVPTGQTGIAIAGWGISIDRVIADFAPGATEQLVLRAASDAELIIVEGQGSINHAAYAPVTLALMYGAGPDALVLVHDVRRTHIRDVGTPLLSYRALIRTYEALCATVKPAKVVAVALNTHGLGDGEARAAIAQAREETGLPADDVVRFGPRALYDAFAPSIVKTQALR